MLRHGAVSDIKKSFSVLVSVPNTGWIHKHVCFATDGILKDPRYDVRLIRPTHNPYENNLHHIVKEWIEQSREDFWLSIDADNPPMNNPLDLVELDKDIIGLPTPVWHCTGKTGERPYYWNVYKHDEPSGAYREWLPHGGLQQVDAIDTGCFMAARRVFEHSAMRMGPFLRTTYPDGRVERGNDIAFCERARNAGFEIWAHYDYPCRHFNEIELTEMITAFTGLGKT